MRPHPSRPRPSSSDDAPEPTRNAPQDGLRDVLRALPSLKGVAPPFDTTHAPEDPVQLFVKWFDIALQAGVTEPHAMTVSTVGADGFPDARILILKAVDADGWHFGVSSVSTKGRHLATNPVAALTFYWPSLVRQVRLTGRVVADPESVRRTDFLARPVGSREIALTRRQSEPLLDPAEIDTALVKARRELAADPDTVPDEWISYVLRPTQVEFWQGDPERKHSRLRYEAVRRVAAYLAVALSDRQPPLRPHLFQNSSQPDVTRHWLTPVNRVSPAPALTRLSKVNHRKLSARPQRWAERKPKPRPRGRLPVTVMICPTTGFPPRDDHRGGRRMVCREQRGAR